MKHYSHPNKHTHNLNFWNHQYSNTVKLHTCVCLNLPRILPQHRKGILLVSPKVWLIFSQKPNIAKFSTKKRKKNQKNTQRELCWPTKIWHLQQVSNGSFLGHCCLLLPVLKSFSQFLCVFCPSFCRTGCYLVFVLVKYPNTPGHGP